MKITTGRYTFQIAFGVVFTNYHNEYKALIIELGLWYIEILFKDYE